MAKIARKHQKIFAGTVSPTGVVATFGSKKAGAIAYSSDPDVIQSLGAWSTGWADAVISNYAPAIQDLNAVCNVLTRQLAYLFQNGVPFWNAVTPYYIGSIASNDLDTIYMSMSNTNLNAAFTDNTKWYNLHSRKVTTVASLDYVVVNNDWYIRVTATADLTNYRVTLPAPNGTLTGRVVIIKYLQTEATNHLYVYVSGGGLGGTIDGASYKTLDRYQVIKLVCNGTNWETI
jgi:hypothetical protein